MFTTVPRPMQLRTVKKTTARIRALASSCQLPKLHPKKVLIPKFIPVKGSTPKAARRYRATLTPMSRIPASIMPVRTGRGSFSPIAVYSSLTSGVPGARQTALGTPDIGWDKWFQQNRLFSVTGSNRWMSWLGKAKRI